MAHIPSMAELKIIAKSAFPVEIRDLLVDPADDIAGDVYNDRLVEAYFRGQKSMEGGKNGKSDRER